jgi:hypothetical protein
VVELVPRNVKDQPSHRAPVTVYSTAAGPRTRRQALQERERRRASRRVLAEEIVQRAALELSMSRIPVFIKAGQLAVFTAGHAHARHSAFEEIKPAHVLSEQVERDVRERLGPERWTRAYKGGRMTSIDALLTDIDSELSAAT